MNELNVKLAKELIDSVFEGAEKAQLLAVLTGDEDLKLLALMLVTLLQAQAAGDIKDIADAVIPVLSQKIEARSGKKTASEDLIKGLNINLN